MGLYQIYQLSKCRYPGKNQESNAIDPSRDDLESTHCKSVGVVYKVYVIEQWLRLTLLVDDYKRLYSYTTQYIGDYQNPLCESIPANQ